MPGENRGISFFNIYIFSYSYDFCHFKVGSVCSLLKRIAALLLGMPAKHCKSFMYVTLHTLTILMLFHSEIKGCAGTKKFHIANLKRI